MHLLDCRFLEAANVAVDLLGNSESSQFLKTCPSFRLDCRGEFLDYDKYDGPSLCERFGYYAAILVVQ